ncbi:MAG: DUF1800 domain-containing protein [Planctomycetota bacterium]|nr:DUF1800 domain-containing protein [Planctomycetota bacterium]
MLRLACALSVSFLAVAPSFAQTSEAELPLTARERASHLLSRFSFGPKQGDVDRVLAMGESAWIEEQLQATSDEPLLDLLSQYESLNMETSSVVQTFNVATKDDETNEQRRERNRLRNQPKRDLLYSIGTRALHSKNQIDEVLCDFWRNHFNVSFTKGGGANYLLTDWERTVIQANALGDFPHMLSASARHPAMLHYLDNSSSRRPPSKQELAEIERRVRRKTGSRQQGEDAAQLALQRGLNENYARELLELHTLGVDNYYKQKDVIALAEVLTGWTFDGGRNGDWNFVFRNNMHVAGDKKILGKRIKSDRNNGEIEGNQVLEILSEHKGTAEFIALKLVRYFVADQPPQKLVKSVAKTYRKTNGDIRSMVNSILESKEFWSRENYRSKFKTPMEFAVSALRVTNAEVEDWRQVNSRLEEMGQPLYHCDDPTGWYDTAEAWLDPGVMALRWQFALDLAAGKLRGVKVADSFYDSIPESMPARLWQHHLTKMILPGGAGERTRSALSQTTDEYLNKTKVPDLRALGPQLLGLLLGSPEFQQQ